MEESLIVCIVIDNAALLRCFKLYLLKNLKTKKLSAVCDVLERRMVLWHFMVGMCVFYRHIAYDKRNITALCTGNIWCKTTPDITRQE